MTKYVAAHRPVFSLNTILTVSAGHAHKKEAAGETQPPKNIYIWLHAQIKVPTIFHKYHIRYFLTPHDHRKWFCQVVQFLAGKSSSCMMCIL